MLSNKIFQPQQSATPSMFPNVSQVSRSLQTPHINRLTTCAAHTSKSTSAGDRDKNIAFLNRCLAATSPMDAPQENRRLNACREIKQPFPYEDLWNLTLFSNNKSLLSAGIGQASEQIMKNMLEVLERKIDLQQATVLPVELVAKTDNLVVPVGGVFNEPDYGAFGSLFSQLPVFNQNGAPVRGIPGGDKMTLSDQTLEAMDRVSGKLGFELNTKTIHNLCEQLATSAVSMHAAINELPENSTFHLVERQGEGSIKFHDVTHLLL